MSTDGLGETFVRQVELDRMGIELKIHQLQMGDVSCVVWDAAIVATKYFERHAHNFNSGKVLELGAGTGVCSVALAVLGCDVTATDLPHTLGLINKNRCENEKLFKGFMRVAPLKWGEKLTENPEKPFDIILLVDCIYYEQAVMPLIGTIKQYSSTETITYCCYEVRDIGGPVASLKLFNEEILKWFNVEPVKQQDFDELYRSPDIIMLKLRLKV